MTTMVQNKVPGADFSEYGMGRKLPAMDRCLGWWEFGATERSSIRNHAQSGSRGHIVAGTTVGASSISAGAFITELANDSTAGTGTLILFCKPGNAGTSFGVVLDAGAVEYSTGGTNESLPTRYGTVIRQRVNNTGNAPFDFIGQFGTYDSTTPAANGTNNSLTKGNTAVEAMCVTQEVNATTRVQTLTYKNAATYATPSSSTNTAAVNHVRDNRTNLPIEVRMTGGSEVYSFMVFNGALTQAEKDAIYAMEKARLTALGVPNL